MSEIKNTHGVFDHFISRMKASGLYQLLFETANDAIFFMSPFRFIDCNMLAVKMFGASSKADIVSRSIWDLSPETQPDGMNSKDNAMKYIADSVSSGSKRFYWKYRRLDGVMFDAEVSLNSITIDEEVYIQAIIRDITHFLETEEALKKSEKKYKNIFENVQDVFYQADAEGILTLISPSISHHSVFTPADLVGKPVDQLYVNPTERVKLMDILKQNGQVTDYEVELFSAPGKTIYVAVNAHLVLNKKNEIVGVEGVLHNITDRKKALDAAVSERIMLRTLIDNLPDTIYVKDSEGRKIIANKADVEHIGAENEQDVSGKTDIELFNGPVGEHGFSQDMKVIKGGKSIVNDTSTYIGRQGETRWLCTSKIPLKGKEGKILGLVGIGRDITTDIESGRALSESEEKYRTLIESMPDGVYRSTPDGRFLEVNDALVKILGYESREELLEIDIKGDLYFSPSDREKAFVAEKKAEMSVYPLRRKDGSRIWVEDHGWQRTDEKGNILFHEGVLRDITERHNFQVQLEKYAADLKIANDTKDKLFSIIAHDLLSPFNSILGFTTLLSDHREEISEDERRQLIGRLKNTSENTYELLQKLLTWSLSQRDSIVVEKSEFTMADLTAEVCTLLGPVSASKSIDLVDKVSLSIKVYADFSMTRQIVYNLVANAVKFSYQGGAVYIDAANRENEIVVSVSDHGVGMSSEQRSSLFEAGFCQSTPGTSQEKGTGLGLVICREFAEKQGGRIWVDSVPGKGSVFSFSLPVNS